MSTPREYIEDIRNRQINSDKFILDSLTGAIDRLQKAFPRYGSFLMEFVQNADDAKSRSLKIEILQNTIRISNDGLVFSEEDVKSICKVGRSSKTAKDYIGYLGVGFKAVFLISECPEIYSGGYGFKFNKTAWPDSEHIPWQVIPVWIDNPKVDLSKYRTVFVLPLKSPNLIEKLREEVRPTHLNSRILLFLRYIEEIEITDVTQNFKRKIVKSKFSKRPEYEIHKIEEYENDTLKREDLRLILRSTCHVPPDVKKDYVTKEWERQNVEKREIMVAFKLYDQNHLIKEEKGTAHIGVFSFLPLKEIPSGLNFLLQADFLTTPGRSELARESLWNSWLAREIYNLITTKCIPTFLGHDHWKMNFTQILYSREDGHELLENYVKTPLNEYLKNNALLIAEDGTPSKAEELISVEEEVRYLLTDSDFKLMYPNKRIIHKECRSYPCDIKFIFDIKHFLDCPESEELIRLKAKKKEVEWFKKLYSMFVDKYNYAYFYNKFSHYNVEHDQFWNSMRYLSRPIILTNDFSVAKIDKCYINPKKIPIPEQLKEKFKIVHPQLVKNEKFGQFRKELNDVRYHDVPPDTKVIGELTEEDIKNALRRQETFKMDEEEWKNLSDEEKIERVKEIKKFWSDYCVSPGDEDWPFDYDLTLKSKTGEWVKPEDLVFPEEYKPEHSIETLIEKEILDFPLKFVSPKFIEDNNDDEIRKWRRFFGEFGVDKIVENKNSKNAIIQRIAVLTALQYEKEKKRLPRELGESEKRGYDIESKSESEERFIEAKGTSDSSYDIFLTVNEFRVLREDKESKYFVYVVTDALRAPFLQTTRGTKLLDIMDTKIIIPFNKWLNEAKDDEFKP
ncbi:hypothetical protein ES702_02665 [subsurface metagenome]